MLVPLAPTPLTTSTAPRDDTCPSAAAPRRSSPRHHIWSAATRVSTQAGSLAGARTWGGRGVGACILAVRGSRAASSGQTPSPRSCPLRPPQQPCASLPPRIGCNGAWAGTEGSIAGHAIRVSAKCKGCAAAHVMSRAVSDVTAARAGARAVAAGASSWLLLHGGKPGSKAVVCWQKGLRNPSPQSESRICAKCEAGGCCPRLDKTDSDLGGSERE